VLAELGLVDVGEHGVRAAAGPDRRELEASERYRAARRRLDEARAFLSIAPTLDLFAPVEPPLAAATG
jgi:single-stranded-DNA-specific exonuclease